MRCANRSATPKWEKRPPMKANPDFPHEFPVRQLIKSLEVSGDRGATPHRVVFVEEWLEDRRMVKQAVGRCQLGRQSPQLRIYAVFKDRSTRIFIAGSSLRWPRPRHCRSAPKVNVPDSLKTWSLMSINLSWSFVSTLSW